MYWYSIYFIQINIKNKTRTYKLLYTKFEVRKTFCNARCKLHFHSSNITRNIRCSGRGNWQHWANIRRRPEPMLSHPHSKGGDREITPRVSRRKVFLNGPHYANLAAFAVGVIEFCIFKLVPYKFAALLK